MPVCTTKTNNPFPSRELILCKPFSPLPSLQNFITTPGRKEVSNHPAKWRLNVETLEFSSVLETLEFGKLNSWPPYLFYDIQFLTIITTSLNRNCHSHITSDEIDSERLRNFSRLARDKARAHTKVCFTPKPVLFLPDHFVFSKSLTEKKNSSQKGTQGDETFFFF